MKINDLILDQTLDCGQCFRWNKDDEGNWIGVVQGKLLKLRQEGQKVFGLDDNASIGHNKGEDFGLVSDVDSVEKEDKPFDENALFSGVNTSLFEYFDLGTDYAKIKDELSNRDAVLKEAIEVGSGIRILKQDLWETLISFIISQNNNIPRIKGCIEKLSENFGEPVEDYKEKTYYSFPTVEKIASLNDDELAPIRLGYRAPYILDTARTICSEGMIREDLGSYKGVGPKVQSCIELFGRHNMDAFPIDVWVKRVMNRCYSIDESDVKTMNQYAKEHFYPYGGIAQQYLFYYIREKGIELK